MTREQTENLRLMLLDVINDFMYDNQPNVAGVNIKIYSSPESFTVVIDSEDKKEANK